MTAADFIAKWSQVDLTERSAAQAHFLDLCELVGHPKPQAADPKGEWFTFERGAAKHGGGDGWADVWKKDFFGWEYKGRHKDLGAAYDQLLEYRADLDNPPLLVVCDLDIIRVHTNFNNAPTRTHEITLATLDQPRSLEILDAVFHAPDKLRPGVTSEAITEKASGHFAEIAESMRQRGLEPQAVAHFLVRVVFCLFAEDVGLLERGLFTRLVTRVGSDPKKFARHVADLFSAMATGGDFLLEPIRHFNGSLFDATPVLELTAAEIAAIGTVAGEDWSAVDVSISGTLFERGLNPAKRSQLGSHYAHDLAQTVVWIGYIQWLRANGYGFPAEPILKRMSANFRCADALFTDWPEVDFIVSNPPFLGGKKLRTGDRKSAGSGLGDEYVEKLFAAYRDRVPAEADLCCYWFEKARGQIEKGKCQRAGLLATNSIRQQQNRLVLQRIKQSGDIFFAESDREWILDGANVRVSMVGFDDGEQSRRVLDGKTVSVINVNLTSQADITQAKRLAENKSIAFMGDTKGGAFDIEESLALDFLHQPTAHGIPNSQVVTPWLNGKDLTGRPRWMWIVDFGVGMDESRASRFEAPFEYVRAHVKPERDKNNREVYRRLWWQHVEARPGMRAALSPLIRFPATVIVAKHRLFVWIDPIYLPDHRLFVFAKDDDCFFGILHSRIHEAWSLSMGSTLEDRPSYSGSTCFETFPFPRPTPAQEAAIAAAAKELNELRERWLNPPEWTQTRTLEFPGSIAGPWSRYIEPSTLNPQLSTGLVRYPRLEPRDADCAAKLKKRTLTNLYNERPAWLDLAHKKLDAAVAAAYGFPADLTDEQILERLLALNLERAAEEEMAAKVKKPKASREKQADVMV